MDRSRTSRTRRQEQGQAAAEFALALPVLVMMLLGVIAFGQMIWTKMDLVSATRDGARRAAVARADTSMSPDAQVRSVVADSLDKVSPSAVTTTVSGTWNQDSNITVSTSMPYSLNIMGIVMWSGNLQSTSQVRIG